MKDKTSTKDLSLTSNERIFLEVKSIFRPKKYKNFNPQGLKIYTFNSGFKKKYKDLLIIIFDNLANNYCVYSKTSTPSTINFPELWFSRPFIHRINVDLPEPEGPQITMRSPGLTDILTFLSA